MKKYKPALKNLKEQDVSIEDLLNELKDMTLSNEDARREFVKIITTVALSNELIAMSFMKKVGESLGEIVNKVINPSSSMLPDRGDVKYRSGGTINMDKGKWSKS